ncbi:MAG TPA: hypothetical protein VFI26_02385 [Lysobacter sp.]|nr:hypothetical protein [Lysobacter sp.]
MNTMMRMALATAVLGMAYAGRVQSAESRIQPANNCQLSVPTIDTKARPRATGFRNEGSNNIFVICGFDHPRGLAANTPTGMSLELTNYDGHHHGVSCTGVVGPQGGSPPQYSTETLTFDEAAFQTRIAMFLPSVFNGASMTNFDMDIVSITCLLPPGVAITQGTLMYDVAGAPM